MFSKTGNCIVDFYCEVLWATIPIKEYKEQIQIIEERSLSSYNHSPTFVPLWE